MVLVLVNTSSFSLDAMAQDRKCEIRTIQSIYEPQVQGRYKRRAPSTSDPAPHNSTLYTPLTLINWNIEGIKTQLSDPDQQFQNADLVMLTETLNVDRPASLPGYTCISSPARQLAKYGRPVGGITLYAKPHLNLHLIHSSDSHIHADTVLGHILVYYFHPSKSAGDIIAQIVRDIHATRDPISIIGGDFNCRVDTNDTKPDTLLAFMSTLGFHLVNDPSVATFVNAQGGNSAIDLVFLRDGHVDGSPRTDVLRTPSRKHQRVFVWAKVKVVRPELYELHRKIGRLNEGRGTGGKTRQEGKKKERKEEKTGWFGKVRETWRKWFG
ncbi:hypothetical protein M8J77_022111 [Diaphorina citri]|nr:hypothetical protein M8J77_022111 [Diaphorina citri]